MPAESSTSVEIYDQTFHLSGGDSEQLRRLAARVDAAMRQIARRSRVVDSLRVAVLAAVNLADENEALREKCRALETTVAERSAKLHEILDGALRRAG